MKKILLLHAGILFLVLLLGSSVIFVLPARTAALDIDILDIGQGDSTLITTPAGRRMLVDTGPDAGILQKELQAVLPPMDKRIDVLLLTHSDKDHIGGAAPVLREYNISLLIVNQEKEIPAGMEEIFAIATDRNIPVAHASRNQDLQLDAWTQLDILTPVPGFESNEANDNSIVFMLLTPGHRFLFSGDAETAAEKALVHSGAPLAAMWYKGGHHGSNTSSTDVFLQAIKPSGVIFQNGAGNSYKHPAKEVMDRLARAKIPVYNTSVTGRIQLHCPPRETCTLTPQYSDST